MLCSHGADAASENLHLLSHALCPPCMAMCLESHQESGVCLWDLESLLRHMLPRQQVIYHLPTTLCNIYNTLGRSISDICDRGKYTVEVRYRGYRPTDRTIYTVLYILYSTVNVQQANLLPGNASQADAIFSRSIYPRYVWDHLAMLKFLWLRNHHGICI